jgi:hypothetical protein
VRDVRIVVRGGGGGSPPRMRVKRARRGGEARSQGRGRGVRTFNRGQSWRSVETASAIAGALRRGEKRHFPTAISE